MDPSKPNSESDPEPDKPPTKPTLIVRQKLAEGKFCVYYADCPARGMSYAVKLFPRNSMGTHQYKKEEIIKKLQHPNIIKYMPMKCHTNNFFGIVLEYCPYGDFYEPVIQGLLTNEILARTYFHQLIEAVEYLHLKGIAHLDLKLENLVFGADFKLKLIDFDQAQSVMDKCASSGGTRCYRAPELAKGECYNLTAADMYSIGVILYIFRAREYPFVERKCWFKKEDINYNVFTKKNNEFWESKKKLLPEKNAFSEEFIQLLNGLLEPDPAKRFGIKDIKESKWYNGPVLDEKRLENEMKVMWKNVMKKI